MFNEKNATLDNKIMKLLGLKEISHIIARTDKGELTLQLRKDEQAINYKFVLDAVPLTEEDNDALKELYNIAG